MIHSIAITCLSIEPVAVPLSSESASGLRISAHDMNRPTENFKDARTVLFQDVRFTFQRVFGGKEGGLRKRRSKGQE